MLTSILAALIGHAAPTADLDAKFRDAINAADAAVTSGRPAEAVATLMPVIAAFERQNASEKRMVFCGMSGPQTIAYMAMGAQAKKSAVAIGPGYCNALYLRGFAYFDLGKIMEARADYQRAVALAPMHAHFLMELGQTYRLTKDWGRMLDLCRQAEGFIGLAAEEDVKREKAFAWRCQGYAQIEQGNWDEAARLYRECLKLDPTDAKAENELKYIEEQRAKPAA